MILDSFSDIFKSSLKESCASYKYNMSKEVEEYLINLCARDLFTSSIRRPEEIIDSLILIGEVPNTPEYLAMLRKNGDYFLSIAGYTPEFFCNKVYDFNHNLLVGRFSYYNLHLKIPNDTLYKSLSHDFIDIIYILNETFDLIKQNSSNSIIETWEAWRLTRHPIFKKKLVRMGMNFSLLSDVSK